MWCFVLVVIIYCVVLSFVRLVLLFLLVFLVFLLSFFLESLGGWCDVKCGGG